jgi:hypothetical protein
MVFLFIFSKCSGDQDSVVPLLGSRTLVRELAHDMKLKVTVSYGAWFDKDQVNIVQLNHIINASRNFSRIIYVILFMEGDKPI